MTEVKSATAMAYLMESGEDFAALVDRLTQQAIIEMQGEMETKIFGSTPTISSGPLAYAPRSRPTQYWALNNKPESKDMNDSDIARRAVEKRKEERAALVAEVIGSFFEGSEWASGDYVSWSVSFHETPDKTYNYVAVRGGSRWYVTGDSSPYTVDGIVTRIVDLALRGTIVSPDFPEV